MTRASTIAVPTRSRPALLLSLVLPGLCSLSLSACRRAAPGDEAVQAVTGLSTPAAPEPGADCPREQIRETQAPEVDPAQEHASYWIAKYEGAADTTGLSPETLAALEARAAALPGGWRDPLGEAGSVPELVERELDERLEWIRGRVEEGKYVELDPGAFARAAQRVEAATPLPQPALRFVASETPLWCIPTRAGLYTEPVDRDFDRNRCASLHPGELVRTLRASPDGAWIYLDAGHSVGWVEQSAAPTLEPAIELEAARERLAPPQAVLSADFEQLRAGSSFPLVRGPSEGAGYVLELPGVEGPVERELDPSAPIASAPLPFSRAELFRRAFALLAQPYGWGGREGQRDCSRYTYDLFAQFGVKLARNSAVQSKLGTRSEDVSSLDEATKRAAIRAAAREGVVLLYMPGHIMIYLGEDHGRDYGISALSEFLTPCEGGEDSVHRLDEVAVTTLELGRGTARRAFIERITRIAVFAPS